LDKAALHQHLTNELRYRETQLLNELETLREDVAGDTKSTAGDKHETGRAMNQLEQERILGQLQLIRSQLNTTQKIDCSLKLETVSFGSLIESNLGYFFISIGIGQLSFEGTTVFCIGQEAPISKFLLGKSIGSYRWNDRELLLNRLY
jgi:hypothetical protein